VVEGVLEESAVGMKSGVVVSAPSPAREGMSASQPEPAEAAAAAPATTVVDVAEEVFGGARLSSPRPVAAVAEEVLVLSQPAAAPQERDASEGTTRAASPEIQEAGEGTGAAFSQGAASYEAQALKLTCTSWAATFEADEYAEDGEEVAVRNSLERGLE
jgi:hypothetical protein